MAQDKHIAGGRKRADSMRPEVAESPKQHVEPVQPGAQGAGQQGDAILPSGETDPEKLRENQDRLGVGEDHKTPDMERKKRGTFP